MLFRILHLNYCFYCVFQSLTSSNYMYVFIPHELRISENLTKKFGKVGEK